MSTAPPIRSSWLPALGLAGGGHFVVRCACGAVVSQCRCPGPKVERRGTCKACKAREWPTAGEESRRAR